MNLIHRKDELLTFALAEREYALLFNLLRLYPTKRSDPKISKAADTAERAEAQKLLEESIADTKRQNSQALTKLLNEPARFNKVQDGYTFFAKTNEIEWLLQVLNDIRVGSWSALGCPDFEHPDTLNLEPQNLHWAFAMEAAGHFQHAFLQALNA